jgi:hypothetical protein
MVVINTIDLPPQEVQPQLFDPDDFYSYPHIEYKDEKMLKNSNAWSVVGYKHSANSEEILAEVFVGEDFRGARVVPSLLVWGEDSEEITSEPEFESTDDSEILWYCKQALCQYSQSTR